MYWEYICVDGDRTLFGDDCAEVSVAIGCGASCGTTGFDYVAATVWNSSYVGEEIEKFRKLIQRQIPKRIQKSESKDSPLPFLGDGADFGAGLHDA